MELWASRLRDVLFCAGITLLVWAPLGRWILLRIGQGRIAAGWPVSIALGLGAWALWVLALGVTGLLYPWVVLLSAVGLFLVLRLHRHLALPGAWTAPQPGSLVDGLLLLPMGGLTLFYLALAAASSFAPETAFDSLNVHLPYARASAATHRVGFEPNNWSSAMPALPLMSYVTAFLFSGVSLAKLFNVLCYLTCGGATYFFARRRWDRSRALAAALLFWSCPVALYESTTAMIDLPLALFSGIGIFALLEWTETDEAAFLWLSAAALGLALGCKYHAVFWIVPAAAIILGHGLWVRHLRARQALSFVIRYLTIAGLLFLPWVIRSWWYTGNPVFPAANSLFKSPYFPPAMEAAAKAAYANEGTGTGVWALLQLPWNVTFRPGLFRGTLGAGFLLGVALVLVRRKTARLRYGLFLAAFYFYAWAFTAQEIRYLLPLVPLLSLLSVAGLLGEGGAGSGKKALVAAQPLLKGAGWLTLLAATTLGIPACYELWIKDWTYWHSYQSPVRFLLGRESAQDYLRRDVPSIYVYDFINEHLNARDRILLLNDASQLYSNVPTLYSFTVEAERLLFAEDEAEILRRLEASRITHVLLNYNGIAPMPGVAPRRGVYFFLDKSFQDRHLEPRFSRNNVVLYRMRR
jgi:hypothetical protein